MRWNEIFNESQQLNELFDKVATWDWTHVDEYNREAQFEVNGTPYRVKLWTDPQSDGVWDAEFVNQSVWAGSRWGNTGTMEHEGIQVFSTVIAVIKDLLTSVKPKLMTFSGYTDEGRDHLYAKMVKHEEPEIRKLGYKVVSTHKGSHMEFDLVRQDAPEERPDQAPEA